jgi:DNA-binding NarL/FixJ family response regulator
MTRADPGRWAVSGLLGLIALQTKTASALVWALSRAQEHGSAAAALAATGIELPAIDRLDGLSDDYDDVLGRLSGETSVREALALGILAGPVADRPARARRPQDPTSFIVGRDLVIQGVEGQSVLRLPWVEDDLFVGRHLPEISEIPTAIRHLSIEHCTAALGGVRNRFAFTSYGHTYMVDHLPVRSQEGDIDAVLAIAIPAHSYTTAIAAYVRTAELLDQSAARAQERAERYRLAGSADAELTERYVAETARQGADRARSSAERLRRRASAQPGDPPWITPRQAEILNLASLGLTSSEMAELLGISVTTIRTHFDNIYSRLGVNDRSAAVATALRHGLIE